MLKKNSNVVIALMLISYVFIIISCKETVNPNTNYGVVLNNIKNIKYDSIIFKIDDSSIPYSSTIQYFEDSENRYFTYFNSTNNFIYFFDYTTKKQDFIWRNVSLNHFFDSYSIESKDSVFLFNTKRKILYLYNLDGKFKEEFDLSYKMKDDSTIFPYPYVSTSLPFINHKDNLYVTGYHVGEFAGEDKQRKTVVKYNLQSKQLDHIINYPNLYNKFNWGITHYYMTTSSYNPFNQLLIINFPLCHDLYIYNLVDNKGGYVYSGSSYIDAIEPFSKDKTDILDTNTRLEYYLTSNSYVSIYYDRHKNIYYRIAALPMAKNDVKGKYFWKKRQYKLIILNDNFNYMGEIAVDNILPDNVFITEEGIHLQVFHSDDMMKFKIINIKI